MITLILIAVCAVSGVLLLGRAPQRGRLSRIVGASGMAEAPRPVTTGDSRGGARSAPTSPLDDLAFDLDLVAVCLQAGLPVTRALEHAARAAGDRSGLDQVARAARWGLEDLHWEGAAAAARSELSAPAGRVLAEVVSVIRFSARTGAALAPLLQSHADELRRSEHRRRQIAAARLGVMLVLPLGVCVLPAFILLGVVPVLLTLVGDLGPAFGGL